MSGACPPWKCPAAPPRWLDRPPNGCCASPPPSGTRKLVAICVAGEVPRIYAEVEETMLRNVIAPLGEAADTFFAVCGSFARPLRVLHAGLRHVPRSTSSSRAQRMASTLSHCYPLMEAAESRLGYKYGWVVRLRTDGLYTFTWGVGSVWSPPPPSHRVVYTTHCQTSDKHFIDNDCKPSLPWREQGCLSDQFAVMSRAAAEPYFLGTFRRSTGLLHTMGECHGCRARRRAGAEAWMDRQTGRETARHFCRLADSIAV